jgi:alpha/beta hydrolase fold
VTREDDESVLPPEKFLTVPPLGTCHVRPERRLRKLRNDLYDVLRDVGEAYAHRLTHAGVRVTATRVLGAIHDLVLLNPISETPPPRAVVALASAWLQALFSSRS